VAEKVAKQHTVPQFYLQGFAKADQVSTVEVASGRTFTQNVSDAASEHHFYSIPQYAPAPNVFEEALARAESDASKVFKQILKDKVWPLAPSDRATLAAFMTLQFLRGRDHRAQMGHIAAGAVDLLVRTMTPEVLIRDAAAKGSAMTEEEAEEAWKMLRESTIETTITAAGHFSQIVDLLPKLITYLLGRPWVLVRFTKRALITSDTPFAPIAHPTSDPNLGIGLATAWGMTYPLDRRTGLILASPQSLIDAGADVGEVERGETDVIQAPTTRLEKFINRSTADSAERWIFRHPDDERFVPEIDRLGVVERGRSRPRVT
jgi:hypothetical protein